MPNIISFVVSSITGILFAGLTIRFIYVNKLNNLRKRLMQNTYLDKDSIINIYSFLAIINDFLIKNNWKFEYFNIKSGEFILKDDSGFINTFFILISLSKEKEKIKIKAQPINIFGFSTKLTIKKSHTLKTFILFLNSNFSFEIIEG